MGVNSENCCSTLAMTHCATPNWTPPEDHGVETELSYFGKSQVFFNLDPNDFVFFIFYNSTCNST